MLDEDAKVPKDLNLAEAWARQRAAFEEYGAGCTITVAVQPAAVGYFTTYSLFQLASGTTVVERGEDDGWPVVELTFRARRAALAIVLAFGGEARLLSPADLREDAVRLARATIEAHQP